MYKKWNNLKENCLSCVKCRLNLTRTNVVFGDGNIKSDILIVGEAPGKTENLEGLPFVGRSGKLLDSLLSDVGLFRQSNIYITNIVKCQPPKNRIPLKEEQNACIEILMEQIKLIDPKIIVALGRIAAMKLIDPKIKITKDHGEFVLKNNIWLMATFHPAAIIRNPSNKKESINDFLNLKNKCKKEKLQI